MSQIKKLFKLILKALAIHFTSFFVVAALIFGVILCFRVAPLFGSDEIVHFPRAFQIQQGQLWEKKLSEHDYGGRLPIQIKQFNDGFREQVQIPQTDKAKLAALEAQYRHEKLNSSKGIDQLTFTSAGVYAPWAYLPAAIGIYMARVLNLPLVWYVYLARIACLLTWLILVYFAIRLFSSAKTYLIALALLPTSLLQASTVGMDGIVNGVSWLLIALTLAIFTKRITLRAPVFLLLLFLSLFLATTKQGYLLIALMPLVIPTSLYAFNNRKSIVLRSLYAIGLVLLTAWYLQVTGPIAGILHYAQRPGLNVNSHAQLQFIVGHPIYTLFMILIQPFTFLYGGIYPGFVGVITNKLIVLPGIVIGLLYLALILSLLSTERTKQMFRYRKLLRLTTLVVLIGTFILINLALYVTFTTVGNTRVEGVQGRYLIPIAPLLAIIPATMVRPDKVHLKWAHIGGYIAIGISCVGLITTTNLVH